MSRNESSCGRGDYNVAGVFALPALRSLYAENGGFLTARHKRMLQRFVWPVLNQDGPQALFLVVVPYKQYVDRAPAGVKAILDPHLSPLQDVLDANPWIEDESYQIDPALIDAELGGELSKHESRDEWNDPEA